MRFVQESGKLVAVTRYLMKQYGRAIAARDPGAREFLTAIYLRERPEVRGHNRLRVEIPARLLPEIFPGLERANVKLMGRYDSILADLFRPDTDYLVSPREMLALCGLVAHLKPASILEIGTCRGATLASVALNAPADCRILTLDIAEQQLQNDDVRKVFGERRIERLIGDSKRFDFSELEGKIDFVFVDGSHVNPEVESDTRNALKLLSPRGTVVWHDFNNDFPDVVDCLSDLARQLPLANVYGTSLVVHSKAR